MTSPHESTSSEPPSPSSRLTRSRAKFLVGGIALALALSPSYSDASVLDREANGSLQEQIGTRVQALGRYDLERVARLNQRQMALTREALDFQAGRDARLQEALGQAIASAARSIEIERAALDAALADARDTQRRARSGAWFQERLGTTIVQTAAAVPPDDPRFAERLRSRIKVLSAMQDRVAQNTETRGATLSAFRAQFPRATLDRLAAAAEDAERAARLYDGSHRARTELALREIHEGLAFSRGGEDYQGLVEAVRAALHGRWGAGGFWEFGAPSLVGIVVAMAWIGVTTPRDSPRTGARASGGNSRTLPYQWRRKVTKAQTTALFSWPREATFGGEGARDVGRRAARDRATRVAILTDQGVAQQGLVEPVKASLAESNVAYTVIDHVSREVPHTVIAEIAARCVQAGTDLLVAVGGGSVIDTAKAVGILLTNGGSILDYEGYERVSRAIMPLYAIPTTAGCGSEASQFCIVLDTTRKKKIEIVSRTLIPERIFIDPMMTRSMPADLTAGCGMDALANAIEAYFSTWASPLTDTLALDAIRLIGENLRAAVANGQNLEARQNMSLAAFEAGLAFTNAQSGAAHALGHSLAGLFAVPQRIGDAILLPHVMKANMYADMGRMVKVAEALGEPVAGLSVREAAERAIDAVKLLLVDVGLPTSLEKVGVDRRAISTLSEQALQDGFLRTNPRALEREDIEAIFEDAFGEYAESGTGLSRR